VANARAASYVRNMPFVPTCPSCKKPVAPRAQNRAYPFCSDRCRAVDLGKWLGEEYRFPDRLEERGDEPSQEPHDPSDA
jgi:endogenous inhibitor of DNA gyrase (YacG/DUF329 family)